MYSRLGKNPKAAPNVKSLLKISELFHANLVTSMANVAGYVADGGWFVYTLLCRIIGDGV